jgi:predicted esterase YcpF (UPF0227 family)
MTATGAAAGVTHLLYLHGFRSSPQSFKARRMADWMRAHRPDVQWWCPQLPPSPHAAVDLLLDGVQDWPADSSAVIGSSLGGFYATVLAERLGWPAVVINPAVEPARDLARHIGEQTSWHDPQDHFFFRAEFIDALRALRPAALSRPQRYLAVIAQGDEVLDWREMHARYADTQIRLIEGSDHALSDFDIHLPQILQFLGLDRAA